MNKNFYKTNSNGDKIWYRNDQYHREDGPAVEYANGGKLWYRDGKLHREDGPAVEYPDGYKEWHINGECHREDGPAIEYQDGQKFWYLNGRQVSKLSGQPCNTQEQFESLMKLRAFW